MMKLAIIILLLLVTCTIAAVLYLESAVKQLTDKVERLYTHCCQLEETVCAIDERLCDEAVTGVADPKSAIEEEEVPVESTEE